MSTIVDLRRKRFQLEDFWKGKPTWLSMPKAEVKEELEDAKKIKRTLRTVDVIYTQIFLFFLNIVNINANILMSSELRSISNEWRNNFTFIGVWPRLYNYQNFYWCIFVYKFHLLAVQLLLTSHLYYIIVYTVFRIV